MKLLIMGIQGSGKGTQSLVISEELGLKHLSTGDLLREETHKGSEEGNEAKEHMEKGELVPNELVERILFKNLPEDNFILDGYPRNIEQAKKLDRINSPDKILFLELKDKEVISRLSNRLSCPNCKEAYGLNRMPQEPWICDNCGEKLIRRKDDNEESIKKRIETFHKETMPLLDYYKDKVIKVDGNRSVEEVFEEIKRKLRN